MCGNILVVMVTIVPVRVTWVKPDPRIASTLKGAVRVGKEGCEGDVGDA